MELETDEEQYQMIVKRQKTFSESLRNDKEFWRDIYSFFEAYTKEFDEFLKGFKAMRYPGYGWRYRDKGKKKENNE